MGRLALLSISNLCVALGVLSGMALYMARTEAAGPESSIVRIELSEYAFSPATVSIPVGKPVILRVVNRGRTTHMLMSPYLASNDLEVEGAEMEVDAPNGIKYVKLRPGKTAEIKLTPATRGTFELVCVMKEAGRSHRELGMTGQLIVE